MTIPVPRASCGAHLAALFILSLLAARPGPAVAEEDLTRFAQHDAISTQTIDHGVWGEFLSAYVVTDPSLALNRVAYGAVRAQDRARLNTYLAQLSETSIDHYNRDEQLAFWLNLYNALTVRLVLEHYPVASIRDIDISPGLFADGPWGATLVEVEGVALSLDDIEHRILRSLWRDPLIHYGVSCASVGCPNLADRPYTGADVHDLLAKGARAYINGPRGVVLAEDRLAVSSIYDWYEEDFGGSDAAVLAHLRAYAESPLRAALESRTGIEEYRYDWSLNEAIVRPD